MDFEHGLRALGVPQETIDRFFAYHKKNPQIWVEFEKLAVEAWNAGAQSWGAKGIGEVLRWRISIERKEEFKICNSFLAYYARIFILKHPYANGLFKLKTIGGLKNE